MSAPLFAADVLFFQRLLRAEGLYLADLDGDWGPKTEAAAAKFDQQSNAIKLAVGEFDQRSERNILTLSLKTQRLAREYLARVLAGGLRARIISGTRTYAEQNALYKQGRFGNPGDRVTNARGGESNHNFCVAFDIGIFTASGGYLQEGIEYTQAANLGLVGSGTGLEWGGHWQKFVDRPHYQLRTGLSVAALRAQFEAGTLKLD